MAAAPKYVALPRKTTPGYPSWRFATVESVDDCLIRLYTEAVGHPPITLYREDGQWGWRTKRNGDPASLQPEDGEPFLYERKNNGTWRAVRDWTRWYAEGFADSIALRHAGCTHRHHEIIDGQCSGCSEFVTDYRALVTA